jgi:hypothetical protein
MVLTDINGAGMEKSSVGSSKGVRVKALQRTTRRRDGKFFADANDFLGRLTSW